jgi:hypothetical protein
VSPVSDPSVYPMTLRIVAGQQFEGDLSELPLGVRNDLWRLVAGLRKRPFASGLGYTVTELRRTKRPGVRVAHFWRDLCRLLHEVDGELLILVGVGRRVPVPGR